MFLRAWILFCTLLVASGWILSWFHALAPLALGILILIHFGVCLHYLSRQGDQTFWRNGPRRLIRRFVKGPLLPPIFLVSLALLLLRALLYPPFHDDGLCYRIPRAMAWIMDRGLTWTGAVDPRLDNRGTVSEWLTVPILMFFRSDRLVFLPNFISALFLPGLIFSFWRRLGVAPRVAWICMWLVPMGFCFALQAFNSSNDSIAAVFAVASFDFLFRAREKRQWRDLAFSMLSLALATGVKLNCFPLVLPWLGLALPVAALVRSRPAATVAVFMTAALVSFLPNGILNLLHGGGFSGLRLEKEFVNPPLAVAVFGNLVLIAEQNVLTLPPLFHPELMAQVNQALDSVGVNQMLFEYFQPPVFTFYPYTAIQQAGFGYIVIATLGLVWLGSRRRDPGLCARNRAGRLIYFVGMGIVFLQFLTAAYTNEPARIVCVFYLLLPPLFFVGAVFYSPLIFRVCRLITAATMLTCLQFCLYDTENPLLGPSVAYYRTHQDMRLTQAALRFFGSTSESIGIMRVWNQRESWLWQPYCTHRVIQFSPLDSPDKIRRAGVRYLAISVQALDSDKITLTQWLAHSSARLLGTQEKGGRRWYFVALTDSNPAGPK